MNEPLVEGIYNHDGVLLQVVESGSGCEDCYFNRENGGCTAVYSSFFDKCEAIRRSDHKNVRYIRIPNEPECTRGPYAALDRVLEDAYNQASTGKGVERHAADNNFEDQVMCAVQRLLKDHPFGGLSFQVIKKTIESGRLYQTKGADAAYQEILGAINYLGGIGVIIKEED